MQVIFRLLPLLTFKAKHLIMSNLKVMNQALDKARNIKELAALDFVKDRTIKNYEQIWGRKDGENWYQAEIAHMLVLFAEKPKLAQCDKLSIWGCLQKAAREGLSIHQGHMDLIPYGNVLKAETNYKGMRHQLRSMPKIKFIGEASLVYKGDKFRYDEKKKEVLQHEREGAPANMALEYIVAAYVTVEFADGKNVDVLMWNQEIVAAKSKSKNQGDASVWSQFPWEMAKKTVIKRANKIYFERPQVQVTGLLEVEAEKTQDVDHEEVDTDTGEVMTAEVVQDEPQQQQQQQQSPPPQQQQRQQAPPPQREQQQARPVSGGMDEFLNS